MNVKKTVMVSILCAVYNHENYLKQCLDGFIKQKTNFNYEVIVHDDASTDASVEIIRKYAEEYPEIIKPIYQKENQYSKGVKIFQFLYLKAQGKYIAFCEGDDYWIDENKLQLQIDLLESHPEYSASTHNEIVVDVNGNPYSEEHQEIYREKTDRILDKTFIYNFCKVAHTASFVYRSSLYTEMTKECWNAYFDIKANGDMKMSALFLANGKVYHFARDMACYRFVNSGTDSWSSRNAHKNLCYETCDQLEHIRRFIKKYYNVELNYNGYYKKRAYESIRLFLKKPSFNNYTIMKSTMKLARYSFGDFMCDLYQRICKKIQRKK